MDFKIRKSDLLFLSICIFLIAFNALTIGLRSDHLMMIGVFVLCYFGHDNSRKLLIAISPFILYGIIYDYMKLFPNYLVNEVSIQEIYNAELSMFGILYEDVTVIPCAYFELVQTDFLNVMTGAFYLCWIPVPFAFTIYLFFVDKSLLFDFLICFFTINILGWIVYYAYPAAPPWYVANYGFDLDFNVASSAAGLLSFDELLGLNIFENIYTQNSNIFAAMPSLHAAYPMPVFYYAIKHKSKILAFFSGIIVVGIWFSAVYTYHHYVIDVIAGFICGSLGIVIYEWIVIKTNFIQKIKNKYLLIIK